MTAAGDRGFDPFSLGASWGSPPGSFSSLLDLADQLQNSVDPSFMLVLSRRRCYRLSKSPWVAGKCSWIFSCIHLYFEATSDAASRLSLRHPSSVSVRRDNLEKDIDLRMFALSHSWRESCTMAAWWVVGTHYPTWIAVPVHTLLSAMCAHQLADLLITHLNLD